MKWVVERDALRKAIDVASIALRDSKDAIYTHYLVEVDDGGKARLRAHDPSFMFADAYLHLDYGEPGSLTLPGKKIGDLVKVSEAGPMTFTQVEDGLVTVQTGQATLSIPTLPVEDFRVPKYEIKGGSTVRPLPRGELMDALKYMKTFVGQDPNKADKMLAEMRNHRWLASDGFKIGMFESDVFEGSCVLHTKALGPLMSFLKESDQVGVSLLSTDQYLWVEDTVNKLAFRKLDHNFSPATEKAMEALVPDEHFLVPREAFEKVLQRLRIVLEKGNSKMDCVLSGEVDGSLEIRAINSNGKVSSEALSVQRKSGGGEIVDFPIDVLQVTSVLQADFFKVENLDFYVSRERGILKVLRANEGIVGTTWMSLPRG